MREARNSGETGIPALPPDTGMAAQRTAAVIRRTVRRRMAGMTAAQEGRNGTAKIPRRTGNREKPMRGKSPETASGRTADRRMRERQPEMPGAGNREKPMRGKLPETGSTEAAGRPMREGKTVNAESRDRRTRRRQAETGSTESPADPMRGSLPETVSAGAVGRPLRGSRQQRGRTGIRGNPMRGRGRRGQIFADRIRCGAGSRR